MVAPHNEYNLLNARLAGIAGYGTVGLLASVAEWSIATDCKSVALRATQVRILPGALDIYAVSAYYFS